MKRLSKHIFFLILLISIWSKGWSQHPIQVQVIPPFDKPVLFSDVLDLQSQFQIILINTDPMVSYDVKLAIRVDGGNGIRLILPPTFQPGRAIKIGAGKTITLNSNNLKIYYPNLKYEDFIIRGFDVNDLTKSQRIPDGDYEICVSAYKYTNTDQLSLPGCVNMNIATLEPPIITFPDNDQDFYNGNPLGIAFDWTIVQGASPKDMVRYDVRFVEVPEGVNPYDAMESDNLLVYEERDYPGTRFIYDRTKPALEINKKYAVQVRAHDRRDRLVIRNDGKSDVVTFNYLESEAPEIDDSYECGEPCVPPVITNAPDIPNLVEDDIIKIGHFTMTIDEATKVGNQFTGKGRINQTNFFVAPIRVEFDNLRVNTNKVVYAGSAIAMQHADLIEVDLINEDAEFFPGGNPNIADIYSVLVDPETAVTSYLSRLLDPDIDVGISLPIGFGEDDARTQIVHMEFGFQGATASMVHIIPVNGALDGTKFLAFGLRDFCVTPGGPSASQDNTFFELLDTVTYRPNDHYTIQLHPAAADRSSGTYAQINCDGFNQITVGGIVSLTRDIFIPEDDMRNPIPNKTMAANFQTQLENFEGLVAELDFNGSTSIPGFVITQNFRIKNLPDYSFSLESALIDASADVNNPEMEFPSFYTPNDPDGWTGIYIKNFRAYLPDYFKNGENERIDVIGHHLMYDDNKHTFAIEATDLMNENNPGKLDDWDFTIDRFFLRVVREELDSGLMTGIMKFDFTETNVEYTAGFRKKDNKLDYSFELNCDRTLSVPMWYSSIKLKPTSKFYMDIVGDEVDVKLELDGELELDGDVGDIPGVEFESFEFEDLTIQDEEPYISGGTFKLEGKVGGTIMGCSATLEDLGLVTPPRNTSGGSAPGTSTSKSALKAKVGIAFGPDENSFAAKGGIAIIAEKNRRTGNWEPKSGKFESLRIDGKTSAVEVHGLIQIYDEDPLYGNAFRGDMEAIFLDQYAGSAEIMLGSKKLAASNKEIDYWYVDGSLRFNPAIPIVGPIGMQGFGGGAYYNMAPSSQYSPSAIGKVNDRPAYEPVDGGWGFKAMAVVATTPTASLFSGDLTLDVSFQRSGALDQINLIGNTYLMKAPSLSGGDDVPMITLNGKTRYNNRTRILDGTFGYKIEIPAGAPLIWGDELNNKRVRFHVANMSNWYVHMGEPGRTQESLLDSMLKVNIGYKFDFFGKERELSAGLYSYFDVGTKMPPVPPLPKAFRENRRGAPLNRSIDASGIMLGLHNKLNFPGFDYSIEDIAGVYLKADGGIGMDLSLLKLENAACNGNPNFGINNWYARGQTYIYGSVEGGGYVDCYFKKFEVNVAAGLAAKLRATLPNPTLLSGGVRIYVDLPILDEVAVKGNFKLGTECEFTNLSEDWAEALGFNQVISDVTMSSTHEVNPFSRANYATIDFRVPLNEIREYPLADGKTLKTKVVYDVKLYEFRNEGGNFVLSRLYVDEIRRLSDNDDELKFHRTANNQVRVYLRKGNGDLILNPSTTYRVEVTGQIWHAFDNGPFELLRDKDGDPIENTVRKMLWTKEFDQRIENITSSYPKSNERYNYVHDNINTKGFIEYTNFNLTQALGNNPIIQAHFAEVGGDPLSSKMTFGSYQGNNKIEFNIPTLKRGKYYHLIIVATPQQAANVEPLTIYDYYFQTSNYGTRQQKFQDLQISSYTTANYNTARSYKLTVTCREPLSNAELNDLNLKYHNHIVSGKSSNWDLIRKQIQEHYFMNGLDYPTIPQEFVLNRSRYQPVGPLSKAEFEAALPQLMLMIMSTSNNQRPVLEINWNPNMRMFIVKQNAINRLRNSNFPPPYLMGSYLPINEEGTVKFEIKYKVQIPFNF